MRRSVSLLAALLMALHCVAGCTQEDAGSSYDTVIVGARVIDPESGMDAIANIGIIGGEIATITEEPIDGSNVLDASGLVAAPGFVDLHAHGQDAYSERIAILDGRTSQLELEAGALPVSKYYEYKEGRSIANYGASVSHVSARVLVMDGIDAEGIALLNHTLEKTGATGNKWAATQATDEQLDRIDDLVIEGLAEGGVGIGLMPGYFTGARSDGLIRAARIARDHNSFLTAHSRYLSLTEPSGVLGIQEMISLSVSYDVPLLVHHVPTNALTGTKDVLDMIDAANSNGARVVGEMFPYIRGSTFIGTTILDEGWQDRTGMDYSDLQWVETGETLTKELFYKYRLERPDGYYIMKHIKEDDMMAALTHPGVIVGSDGMVYVDEDANLLPADAPFGVGLGHPRGAGTYAKYLRIAIEEGSLSLPQILAKTSYLPARFIEDFAPSMKRRGRLQEGMVADITIFDPELVTDNADYAPGTSSLPSSGFVHVLVNGQPVVSDGAVLQNVFPGQPIRGEQSPK
jgi:hypothetical protein